MGIVIAVVMWMVAYLLWRAAHHYRDEYYRLEPIRAEGDLEVARKLYATILCAMGSWIVGALSFVVLIYPFLPQ